MPRKAPTIADVPTTIPIAKKPKAKKASSKTKVVTSLLPPIEDLPTSLKTIIAKCRTEEAMVTVRPLSLVPPFAGLVASELEHMTSVISEMDGFWSTVILKDHYLEADHAIYESDKRQLLSILNQLNNLEFHGHWLTFKRLGKSFGVMTSRIYAHLWRWNSHIVSSN